MRQRISIVIPAFNEEKRIEKTIRAIADYMAHNGSHHEIIVSDDGSTDATTDIVTRLKRDTLPLRLISSDRNRGKGSAVRQGVAASQGDLVLVTDADLATPIEEFENLAERIRQGADIAIGSRGLRDSRLVIRQPRYRELPGRLFNVLAQLTVLSRIGDTQCGFKLFRGGVARELFARSAIDGFAFDLEVLGLAARAGHRIAEVPVRWSHMPHSKLRLGRDGMLMFLDLMKIAYRLHIGGVASPAASSAADRTPIDGLDGD